MDNTIAVAFKNVNKIYTLHNNSRNIFAKKKRFYALKDISFEVEKGTVVGVLGSNGSGKSTLSNLLAGISVPDSGEVVIIGEQSLVAIKTGLNAQLSGLENIYLKGALLGLKKKEVQAIVERVVEFSELGDFLYQPVKKYSSGMKSRLGFSISVALNPDIIIIDEALSVGDKAFAAKCMQKMDSLKDEGKTIFFVSHSLAQVRKFCSKGLWIEQGSFKEYGDITNVSTNYEAFMEAQKELSKEELKQMKKDIFNARLVKRRIK